MPSNLPPGVTDRMIEEQAGALDSNERLLIAYGHGKACLLAVQGQTVELYLSEDCGLFQEQVREWGLTDEDPKAGIWVWEGVPAVEYSGDGEGGREFDGWDFSGGTWRKPTEDEAKAAIEGYSPWRSALPEAPPFEDEPAEEQA